MQGKKINQLINNFEDEGLKKVKWDGTGIDGMFLSSGIYFYKIKVGSIFKTGKILLLK